VFNYDHLHQQLDNKGVRPYQSSEADFFQGDINFKQKAFGWIGAIRRRGVSREQKLLEDAIHETFGLPGVVRISQPNDAYPTQTVATTEGEPSDEDSASTDSDCNIWRYTKVLQERFLGRSEAPVYRVLTLRAYPPKFGSVVTYRGETFSAKAGNKKLAKHRSSKKLCDHLGIEVDGI
jgi:hypothetical protein